MCQKKKFHFRMQSVLLTSCTAPTHVCRKCAGELPNPFGTRLPTSSWQLLLSQAPLPPPPAAPGCSCCSPEESGWGPLAPPLPLLPAPGFSCRLSQFWWGQTSVVCREGAILAAWKGQCSGRDIEARQPEAGARGTACSNPWAAHPQDLACRRTSLPSEPRLKCWVPRRN